MQKGDHLSLRISHLEPEKRRVGFTQRWGTEADDDLGAADAGPAAGAVEDSAADERAST